ncbi:MAG TPA: PEP-CTERM sorting domain-containing protein [Methylomirabilota bacterium]|jgi:hypothetical protein
MLKTAAVFALAIVAVLGSFTAAPAVAIFSSGAGDGVGTLTCVSGAVACPSTVVDITTPNPAWQPNNPGGSNGVWVSFSAGHGTAGPNVAAPNADPGNQTVTFNYSFSLLGPSRLDLSIWADDTARIVVDGVERIAGNGVQDTRCAAGAIGCESGEAGTISALLLGTGSHDIDFEVYQRVVNGTIGTPFGLLFAGELTPVPEPASILLLGSALTAVGMASKRRWFNKKG